MVNYVNRMYNNLQQFGIYSRRLVHTVNHSDHVTLHQYVLIHANVPDINAYMNVMMNISTSSLLSALLSVSLWYKK